MKSYTDIEQSKKLAEILPAESADMIYYWFDNFELNNEWYELSLGTNRVNDKDIPCWSLAALLEQFEDTAGLAKDYGLWFCYDNRKSYCTKHYDNPIDACMEMLYKLKEIDLL